MVTLVLDRSALTSWWSEQSRLKDDGCSLTFAERIRSERCERNGFESTTRGWTGRPMRMQSRREEVADESYASGETESALGTSTNPRLRLTQLVTLRAGCRDRTDDIFFTREVLYQLS